MFDTNGLIIALISGMILGYYSYDTQKKDNKLDYTKILTIFTVTLLIVYMLYTLIMDTNENTQVLNNIHHGEAPF